MSYKLSICIPTYNRAKYLPELLDSIINQIDTSNPVEICISDNASEDDTKELVESYKCRYPHIIYFRWPSNMGADRNYLKVVDIASGEYCWMMGSDDALMLGAVGEVMSYLGCQRDIILCERIDCDINLVPKRKLKFLSLDYNKEFNLSDEDDFVAMAFYARNLGAFFSYISSLIFLRSNWVQIHCDDRVIGSAYVHVYMLLMYCNTFPKNILLYVARPLVLCRGYNDSFLSGDVAKRNLLDFNGYELIARLLFLYKPIKYTSMLWVLEKEIKRSMCFKSLLYKRFFSEEIAYSILCISCRYLYASVGFRIRFLICDVLYRTPFLRHVVKVLLYFVKEKILKRSFRTVKDL